MIPPLIGGGAMGQLVRERDWAATPLGAYATWSQALRSSLSLVLNSKGIAALYWGPEQWLLYNDAYGEALGDRHPDAFGRPMPEVLTDIGPVLGPQVANVLATGEGFAIENLSMTMRRFGRDEETAWTYSFSPVQGEAGGFAGVLLLATEMTAQRAAERRQVKAEAALREINATLESRVAVLASERDQFWRLSRDPFVICDLEGRWLDASPVWTEILGWSRDELLGRTSAWMEHPDDHDATRQKVVDVGQGQVALAFNNRFRSRDGSYHSFSWTAVSERERLFCVARDVTAEKAQAEALQATMRRANTYFDFSNDYLFLIGVDVDGVARFVDMNPACEIVMGLVRADIVGCVVDDIVPPDSAADINENARLCLTTRAPRTYLAARGYQEGSNVVIEGRATCVECDDDGSGLVLFSGSDVTERRKIEDQLRQAQKMEAVGQLTGGLAHDFNNLLTGMMGNLELLQLRVARGRLDDLDRFINAAQGAGRRAAALTQRLLAFSRRQTLDPKPTDVNRLLAGLDELLRRTVGAIVDIEIVQAAGLWTADIDAAQLENAVLNLCINGRDAMPEGGKLTVETANKWIDDRTGRERDLPPGQYISICVTDTGTGMSADTIARAFEPFYTTKPIGQGTGLGLSMIYGFARQSGGQVRIYSEVGQGTTVCIYLPRHHGDAADAGDEEVSGMIASAGTQTVLVVDDEATIRHLIDEVLDDLGYTVIGAADGAAGLKVLQSGARIELLITDVGLPNGMNGRQVADAARALRPGLQVLFITGFAENAAVGNGHLEPGMELLTKPFTLEALSTKVAAMLANPTLNDMNERPKLRS